MILSESGICVSAFAEQDRVFVGYETRPDVRILQVSRAAVNASAVVRASSCFYFSIDTRNRRVIKKNVCVVCVCISAQTTNPAVTKNIFFSSNKNFERFDRNYKCKHTYY